jgi:hypothetical protein
MSSLEDGPRDLWISTKADSSNGVLIEVRDTGPGLEPKNEPRLFEAFYTTKPTGMGMGLSISRTIIDDHGGRLWASANKPRDAIFQFTAPAHSDSGSCWVLRLSHADGAPLCSDAHERSGGEAHTEDRARTPCPSCPRQGSWC